MTDYRAMYEELQRAWEALPIDLVILRRVDSTNRLARSIATELEEDEIEAHRTFFLTWEQTAGRGRHGRSWISPPGGGIYGTLLIPVSTEVAIRTLPLLTGVALCRSVDDLIDSSCGLKWPNDLLVGGRKIGGILIEASLGSGGEGHAALGFGVNYDDAVRKAAGPDATTLQGESEEPPSYPDAVLSLVHGLLDTLAHTDDLEWSIESFRRASVHEPGDAIRCRVGEEEIRGRFVDLSSEGSLVLETGEGERRLDAGEVVES